MRCAVFGTRSFDETSLARAGAGRVEFAFFKPNLSSQTAALAQGCALACLVVGDDGGRSSLQALKRAGVRGIALRSAGYNHVDLVAAYELGLPVLRVPSYSPSSVAEHAAALLLTLDRKVHRAYNRVREHNFSIEGLLGQGLHGRTVGIVGLGQIGAAFARIMAGFGCRLLGLDPAEPEEARALGVRFVNRETLFRESFVVSLHCPLVPATRHLVGEAELQSMPPGAYLINTSRGAVVDHAALVRVLKKGRIGGVGLDVYEEEEGVFFHDLSDQVLEDDQLARLLTFPNVIITAHQGFFTQPALDAIAEQTVQNLLWLDGGSWPAEFEVSAKTHMPGGTAP
ncbi:MAG: 2-hydroxyacid dehydrogenase [Fimbriimonadaceae bacterium]|nr:2-hydroxyacid dehydrogenase [Fimbriimonadaceae bacterium]QYK57819.1 MAG: 2-hydroxyacid dehydrogenase [Fimbriimonadaceae bacterium]